MAGITDRRHAAARVSPGQGKLVGETGRAQIEQARRELALQLDHARQLERMTGAVAKERVAGPIPGVFSWGASGFTTSRCSQSKRRVD
jgi:hypothetical protein